MERKNLFLCLLLVVSMLLLAACGNEGVDVPVDLELQIEKDLLGEEDEEVGIIDYVKIEKSEDKIDISEDKTGEVIPTYNVVRVVDGDTIIISLNGKNERVRLIGIDTPESVHPDASKNVAEGELASNFTKKLLEGRSVALELDVQERDHYGRILAYIYIDDIMVNKLLLEKGMANVATYPPNVKYVDDFLDLERVAREQKIGFWAEELQEQTNRDTSQPVSVPTEDKLVGSTKSDKYHRASCQHAKQIKASNLISFNNNSDAESKGYTACKACH